MAKQPKKPTVDLMKAFKKSFGSKPKRKRSKAEAKKRIDDLPEAPNIPLLPPLLKPAPKLISRGAKELGKILIDVDPLDRLEATASPQPLPITRLSPESFIPATSEQEVPIMMTRDEAIMTVVNDPTIELTREMLDVINDPSIMMNGNGELLRVTLADQFRRDKLEPRPKRKVSKYQKELGRQLKMLKKKHPRTKVTALMKRAHRATRKALSK
jgi:hypothetical protein